MKTVLCAAAAATLLLATAVPAWSQSPSGTSVALIDMRVVFQNHSRFKAAIDDMRNDVKSYEASLAGQQKQAVSLNEQLGNFKVGSPQYKQIEGQLVQMTTEAQVGMALKRKEFLDREAKIYFHAYMEVLDHIREHSVRNNITLVIAHNSDAIDPAQRQSVVEGINRDVVYQQIVDITPEIVQRLNRGTPPAAISAGPQIPVQRR